jgi:hypothetical protein
VSPSKESDVSNLIDIRYRIGCSILGAVLCSAGSVHAQDQACDELPGKIIYGVGGSAQLKYIGRIAEQLAGADDPIAVVYAAPGACQAMVVLDPKNAGTADSKITGTANYWVAGDVAAKTCNLPTEGVEVTWGSMQQTSKLCEVDKLFDGIGDFEGPVGTTNLVVNLDSTENAISAEAAHFVFGFGDDSGVEPWTVGDLVARRNEQSAVQLYLGLAAQVPATRFVGVDSKNQAGVITAVTSAPADQRSAAIGVVSGDAADAARDKVRTLAWQQTGQNAAYWPDSSSTAFDKINVRNGQYYLWGTTHFFAPVGSDKKVKDASTRTFIDYIVGAKDPDGLASSIDIAIDAGYVPSCAMHVTRAGDLAPLASFQPDEPCDCYFESKATGSSDCDTCESDDDCTKSGSKCRNGFCEVK